MDISLTQALRQRLEFLINNLTICCELSTPRERTDWLTVSIGAYAARWGGVFPYRGCQRETMPFLFIFSNGEINRTIQFLVRSIL